MVYELATITSVDTTPHALTTARTPASWVQFIAGPANVSPVNIGGTGTTNARGLPIPAGGGQMYPPIADLTAYDLSTIKYAFQSGGGDKLYVIYGRR